MYDDQENPKKPVVVVVVVVGVGIGGSNSYREATGHANQMLANSKCSLQQKAKCSYNCWMAVCARQHHNQHRAYDGQERPKRP